MLLHLKKNLFAGFFGKWKIYSVAQGKWDDRGDGKGAGNRVGRWWWFFSRQKELQENWVFPLDPRLMAATSQPAPCSAVLPHRAFRPIFCTFLSLTQPKKIIFLKWKPVWSCWFWERQKPAGIIPGTAQAWIFPAHHRWDIYLKKKTKNKQKAKLYANILLFSQFSWQNWTTHCHNVVLKHIGFNSMRGKGWGECASALPGCECYTGFFIK